MAKIRCTCICHTRPGVTHFQACCDNGWIEVSDDDPRVQEQRVVEFHTGPEGERLKDEAIRREFAKMNVQKDFEKYRSS